MAVAMDAYDPQGLSLTNISPFTPIDADSDDELGKTMSCNFLISRLTDV